MKINPNSPKYQASIRRWNTYQARKRLERKVQTCFAPDSRFYTLPLDLHRFKLTPDLLFWHWRAAFIAPLRERLSQYAPPLPLRYVYALDLHTYDTPVFYLLTDAPHAAVQATAPSACAPRARSCTRPCTICTSVRSASRPPGRRSWPPAARARSCGSTGSLL